MTLSDSSPGTITHHPLPIGGESESETDAADLMAILLGRPAWHADACCREHPEICWHPLPGYSTRAAKAICGRCLVADECLQYALADPDLTGLWAGTSWRERRRIRAQQDQENSR